MDRSTVIVEDFIPSPAGAVVLTLQRGVSTWASWTFQPGDAGTEITVGSSPGCDWQVAAPGVPSIALHFTGEELFAWVEQVREETRCNDATLPLGFTQLRHGDRLDLGAARIVVSLGFELARVMPPRLSHKPGPQVSAPAAELRVRRGSSRLPAWTFSPSDMGKAVVVGAADECDVQIIAAGVEARELVVLFAGDTLLVKSARKDLGPKLNGQYLTEEWQFLRDEDRLDMGMACIDVHLAGTDLSSSGEREIREERPAAREHGAATRPLVRQHSAAPRPAARERPVEARPAARERTVEARPLLRERTTEAARRPGVGTRPLVREPSSTRVPQAMLCAPPFRTLLEAPRPKQASPRASTSMKLPLLAHMPQVAHRLTQPVTPVTSMESGAEGELLGCLFEPERAQTASSTRKYVAASVALGCAYVVWLSLLESWWPGW